MTSRAPLNPEDANYLAKLLGMLGSDHAGEVANAGRKANAFIRRLGLTWADVIYCPPDSWQQAAAACRKYESLLNERERDFLANISRLRRPPSDRQLAWLENIYTRLYARDAA
jgi:hypothetical protein